jgi:hypothetical protein
MHQRLCRMLAVCAAGAFLSVGCSSPHGGALPAGEVFGSARTTSRPHAVAYTFRVTNDTDVVLAQTLLQRYCMERTSGDADIAAHSTSDVRVEIAQDPKCPVAAAFVEGYEVRGGPSNRRAEFMFDYVRSNSRVGKPHVGASGRGWNGLCGAPIRDEAAKIVGIHIFNGQSPTAGCYKTAAVSPKAIVPFTLKIINRTIVTFDALTYSSRCIEGTPSGSIPPGTTQFDMRTTERKLDWCDYGSMFLAVLEVPPDGKGRDAAVIDWKYLEPSAPKIFADGYNGCHARELDPETVVVDKIGGELCYPRGGE